MFIDAAPKRERVSPKPYTFAHCVAFKGGAPSTCVEIKFQATHAIDVVA